MPIRKSEQARYPKDWPQIRARILARAENRCEWPGCGAPDKELIFRRKANLEQWRGANSADLGETDHEYKAVMVCLTIAHLDHTPENCDDDNLKAWCQLHHLRYDAGHHATNASETRKTKRDANRPLLQEQP